ncbi:18107_t:CDS:2 [Racocetra fulgida]|uniref:18107_t:CDS:1 n=1 Tax=Racocetra fulgida TaxID=60492 RepID=A0A9N9FWA6_9GLOM|nr:18107_t:CDS:2 [Racocetra fulgida]
MGPFAYSPNHLWKVINQRDFGLLKSIGGLIAIIEGLRTDCTNGLNANEESKPLAPKFRDEFPNVSGYENILDEYPDSEINFMDNIPFSDRIRAFGKNVLPEDKTKSFLDFIYENVTIKIQWIKGIAIIIAILIVVLVGSLSDWHQEKQFRRLNAKKEDRKVKIIRDVGDIVQLELADGILISGYNIHCDQI